ncbi:MAG: aspartyl/glutamyl-tRNA amidotransferase subunit C [Phycisphaerales bacterium]|nr:MAG: aspartyl/glutamyl-tRNA amidotransferase subunit C [Phycisphaerales bacterium]
MQEHETNTSGDGASERLKALEPLTSERVRRIAALSRLELSEADVETERVRLAALLGYVERLRAVPIEDVPGTEGDAPGASEDDRPVGPLAPDEPGEVLGVEVLGRMSPDSVGAYFRVPRVLGEGGA